MKVIKSLLPIYLIWASLWLVVGMYSRSSQPLFLAFIPPLALFYVYSLIKFLLFPILIACITSLLFVLLIRRTKTHQVFKIFITCFVFVLSFLYSGEKYLESRISYLLPNPRPECIIHESFIRALISLDKSYRHTVFAHNGYVYRWSYRDNNFYKSPTLLFTLECTPEHKEYWGGIRESWN
jgi:glucan phosphoethanolaminetransferase (alkaline phosphatase superfamily)